VVEVVRGKQIIQVDGQVLRDAADRAERVLVDLGTGNGRWIYGVARRFPKWFCIGIDANARGMREVSSRADRKPARGGAENVWFVRRAVEALPDGLERLADEIYIHFPWGSLLQAIYKPELSTLTRIAQLGKRRASLMVRINTSILDDPTVCTRLELPLPGPDARSRLDHTYAMAGIRLTAVRTLDEAPLTAWGRRLTSGHSGLVLVLDGIVIDPADSIIG